MVADVLEAPQPSERRRPAVAWAALMAATVAIVPTAFVVAAELRSEFQEGGSIESHEAVTLVFIVVMLGAIASLLIASARRAAPRPETYLAVATGGLVAVGSITAWFGGIYAVAAALSAVAWIARGAIGRSITGQVPVALASAAVVFGLSLVENVVSAAVSR